MNFELTETNEYIVLSVLENKINAVIAPSFKTELIHLASKNKSLICDVSQVDYIDSSGLSGFLTGDRVFKKASFKFVICNASEKTKKLVKLTKLDTILILISSLQEAKDYILMDELEKNL